MKLSNKLEVAKNNGFSKGMIFFYIMRILSFIGVLNVLNSFLETKKLDVYYGINVPGAYWFLVVLNASLFMVYCYGIWSVSRNGYYFVIAYIVSQPILNILQYAIYDEYFPYIEFSFQEVISKVLASIIVASLYFIYIRNRKFIFSIDRNDFHIDLDFFVHAYKNDCKSLNDISKIYMIDKKSLQNNIDILKNKYGKCVQYENYLISFSPFETIDLSKAEYKESRDNNCENTNEEIVCVENIDIKGPEAIHIIEKQGEEIQSCDLDNKVSEKHGKISNKFTGLLISICVLSTVSLLLAFSIVLITFMYKSEIKELNSTISEKKEEITSKNAEIRNLKSKIDKYESANAYDELDDYDKMFIKVISVPNDNSDYEHSSGTFFASHSCIVTPEGEKYHKINCQHIRNMEKYKIMNIKAAESYGYEKCSDCFD